MADNRTYNVPASVHTAVFRAIDDVIRDDDDVTRIFGESIRSWRGHRLDGDEWSIDMAPGLKLNPVMGDDDWYGPAEFRSSLMVEFELAVPGVNYDDAMDLVAVVVRAIYPADPTARMAIQQYLVNAGATTGEPVVKIPGGAFSMPGDEGRPALLVAAFRIETEIRHAFNA